MSTKPAGLNTAKARPMLVWRSIGIAIVAVSLVAASTVAAIVGRNLRPESADESAAGVRGVSGVLGALVEGDGGGYTPDVSPDNAAVGGMRPLRRVGVPNADPLAETAPPSSALQADRRHAPRHVRLLVLTADDSEANFRSLLVGVSRLGVPADVLVVRTHVLTEAVLWNGTDTAFYSGVILATSELVYHDAASGTWKPGFTPSEISLLWTFEEAFGVRQATLGTFPDGPGGSYGLEFERFDDIGFRAEHATLTPAGSEVFKYLKPQARIPLSFSRVFRARAVDPDRTTPLLVDAAGHLLVSVTRFADGRENLAVTMTVSPDDVHWLALLHGVIGWAASGIYLGEYHANFDAQIDDLFLVGALWDVDAQSAKTGRAYRMSVDDFLALGRWQASIRRRPQLRDVRLEWAFNGVGATSPEGKALAEVVAATKNDWNFINHTWAHRDLDQLRYDEVVDAVVRNEEFARSFGLVNYSSDALVQPNISGLHNPEFVRAAVDSGLRYLIADASRPEWANPSPNTGFRSSLAPELLVIPRRTTVMFANVSTPQEWVSEFNYLYGPESAKPVYSRALTYEEIIDNESDLVLKALIIGDVDPWMFHIPNAKNYQDGRSLMSDLFDATFAKFEAIMDVPVRNLRMSEVGAAMNARMAYDHSGADAVWTPCVGLTLTVQEAATVPITGLAAGPNLERYGRETIVHVRADPGKPTLLAAPAC